MDQTNELINDKDICRTFWGCLMQNFLWLFDAYGHLFKGPLKKK